MQGVQIYSNNLKGVLNMGKTPKAPPTILRLSQVEERTGLSGSYIYNLMSNDEFPRPIKLGPRAVGWVESDINDWLMERIAESRGSKQ